MRRPALFRPLPPGPTGSRRRRRPLVSWPRGRGSRWAQAEVRRHGDRHAQTTDDKHDHQTTDDDHDHRGTTDLHHHTAAGDDHDHHTAARVDDDVPATDGAERGTTTTVIPGIGPLTPLSGVTTVETGLPSAGSKLLVIALGSLGLAMILTALFLRRRFRADRGGAPS